MQINYFLILIVRNLFKYSFFKKLYKDIVFRSSSALTPLLLSIELGIDIKNIWDIGANQGYWTKSRKIIYPNANFILFESNIKHYKKLSKYGLPIIATLSNIEKEVDFFYIPDGDGTGDSYYKESTKYYQETSPSKVKTSTLKSIFSEKNLSVPDYIKLDTQGSELDILKGFGEDIKSVALISVEVNIYDYNAGAPRLPEIVSYLREHDLYLVGVIEQHLNKYLYARGILNQIDVLFCNKKYLQERVA